MNQRKFQNLQRRALALTIARDYFVNNAPDNVIANIVSEELSLIIDKISDKLLLDEEEEAERFTTALLAARGVWAEDKQVD